MSSSTNGSSAVVVDDTVDEPTGFGSVTGLPDLPPGFAETFRSRRIDVGRLRLHAVVGGDGPLLLLVGGWPQFWWQWRHVMSTLSRRFTVAAVDPPGVGLSDRPETGYDSTIVGSDLLALAERLAPGQAFHLVGHDLGMWHAYAMAADQPDRVASLVLIEANLPGVSDSPGVLPERLAEAQTQWHFGFNRLPEVNERLVQGREDVFLGDQFAVKGATPAAMPPEVVAVYVEALRRPGALHACFGCYREVETTMSDNRRRARSPLPMPVLAVGGAASRGSGVADDVRRVARHVQPVVLAGCGHYVAEEAPDALLEALDVFLPRQ